MKKLTTDQYDRLRLVDGNVDAPNRCVHNQPLTAQCDKCKRETESAQAVLAKADRR